MSNIYDGAFRTVLNDCEKLILPLINELFGEAYTGNETIEFFPNEHFIDQQDAADQERSQILILQSLERPGKNTILNARAACRTGGLRYAFLSTTHR